MDISRLQELTSSKKLILTNFINKLKLNPKQISQLRICHIGMRCESHDEYLQILEILREYEVFNTKNESLINGRYISVVKFTKQGHNDFGFQYLEIGDIKPESIKKPGVDHIELVFPDKTQYAVMLYKKIQQAGYTVSELDRKSSGYKNTLYEVVIENNFRIIFSQGEYLWEKINTEFSLEV